MQNKTDIFLQKDYGKAYEEHMNGVLEQFSFKNDIGEVFVQYLKRKIPYSLENLVYYDTITPYGYGGPVILDCEEGQEPQLVQAFHQAFTQHCLDHNIVCEFVCFHPLLHNFEDFSSVYHPLHVRSCLFTPLAGDFLKDEFHSKSQRCIRRALEEGVTYEYITDITEKDLDDFIDIYYKNMNLVQASPFYYFPKSYFQYLVSAFPKQILLIRICFKNLIIGMDFNFLSFPYIYSHLRGTNRDYSLLFPSAMGIYATSIYGKEHHYELLFHGGGVTDSPNDGLFHFKHQFTKTGIGVYAQSTHIFNSEIYDKFTSLHNANCAKDTISDDFFPAYRA